MLLSGQKLTLGLMATINLETVPFHTYAPFPALPPFLNSSWELCWYLNCVKMATSVLFSIEEQRKIGWVGDDSRVVLVKNSLVKREV
jgi:hypothetical protein